MPRRLAAARRLAASCACGCSRASSTSSSSTSFASASESVSESSTFIAVTAAEIGPSLISPRIRSLSESPEAIGADPPRSMRLTPGHGSVFGNSTRSL